jgi:trimethylamine--corrinoid protein Co-methyltransferase
MIYESVGMYASLMGFSPEGMVLGNDLIGQAQRCVRGIDVTEDALSLDVMKAVCLDGGPGHYLGSDQTLALMQTEYLYPDIGNRLTPKDWVEAGKPDLIEAARNAGRTASCNRRPVRCHRTSTAPSARVSRSGSEHQQGKDGP